MNDSLRSQLKQWKKDHLEIKKEKNVNEKNESLKKRTEKLSERDILNLMGIGRPTYSRGKGGAYKQK
ncbi:hypothetical protein ACR0S4_24215 [Priestia megaterium]|uniref:hypothetical protein n=1 Tax=Priestia megaterium TaxID=1404 RepID=UPI003D983E18